MLQFYKVVWQHTLGVVGNVIYCFCCKFNRLSSSEKNLKICYDLIKLSSQEGGTFFETVTVYIMHQMKMESHVQQEFVL